MSHLSSLLPKLLYKHDDFCCLCLKTIQGNRSEMDDEVVLLENCVEKTITITEIFSYVFGEEVISSISAFKEFCMQCITTAVNSYKYIKEVKANIQHLNDAIDYADFCLGLTSENVKGFNSVFVYLSSDLTTTNYYYDNISSVVNTSDVFSKFAGLREKKKTEQMSAEKKSEIKVVEKDKKRNIISTNLMLLDKCDPDNLTCKECHKKFESVPNLRNHYLRVHAPKIYKCPDCPRSYGARNFLKSHQKISHVTDMCSECGKIFNNSHTLREHEKTHYLRFVCEDCGRVYKNQNTYKKHLENNVCQTLVRNSQDDAKFTCDYCQKKYTQKMSLRVHIQYEHGNYKSHVCKWCKKKFWCQSRLRAHIVKHTKEKNFVCTICDGKYVTKESLLYHTRIHTGERPYPCPHCDSRFLSASRRTAHIRSHHMNPTVECDVCHSRFKSVQYLLKHKKIHEDSSISFENWEQEKALSSIQENSTALHKGANNVLNGNNSRPKLVYNVVKMEDNVIHIEEPQPDDIDHSNVEYYLINKVEANQDNEQLYVEVTEHIEV